MKTLCVLKHILHDQYSRQICTSGFSTQSNYNLVSDKIHQSIMQTPPPKKNKNTNNMVINRSFMKAQLTI